MLPSAVTIQGHDMISWTSTKKNEKINNQIVACFTQILIISFLKNNLVIINKNGFAQNTKCNN